MDDAARRIYELFGFDPDDPVIVAEHNAEAARRAQAAADRDATLEQLRAAAVDYAVSASELMPGTLTVSFEL